MPRRLFGIVCRILIVLGLSSLLAEGQILNLDNEVQISATLTNTTATLSGKAELHVTGSGDPIPGCTIHLNSPDAWFFMEAIVPSVVNSTFLSRLRVNGANALLGTNVRVVQFGMGTVVIPHAPGFTPLEVFDGSNFTGTSKLLSQYTAYNNVALGPLKTAISSFRLKRGYMATFAQQENGTGTSKCYVAQDGDLDIGVLPSGLNNNIRFIRIFPWRWVSKKGICGDIEQNLQVKWLYNWNLSRTSPLDWEYVPIRQTRWWPGLDEDWKYRGATHVLGYNEPDQSNQANMSVADAIAGWPDLLATGLRVGAPAVSDGGVDWWLFPFMDQANAAGLRVDYVPVHYYRSYSNPADPVGAANQFYNFLKRIHDRVQRPIWVTEWNNGANWTGDADPSFAQQQATVAAMLEMLDNAPFVERYSLYNWVEDARRVTWDDQSLTAAGVSYRDNASPNAYLQEIPDSGTSAAADYLFEGSLLDTSGSGNTGVPYGTPSFATGKQGQAVSLDGTHDYVALPPRLGDSVDFTFSAWVNWNGGGNWQRIFDLGDGQDRNLFVTPKSGNNTLRFVIKNGGAEQQLNGTTLTPGVWTHLAVTLEGDTGKLFVNGTLVNTNSAMTINPADIGTRTNYLGKSQWPDPLFSGKIDSARFLTYALTDAQVTAAASTGTLQFNSDPFVLPAATPLQPYTGSLAGSASSGNGGRVFTKIGGPAWLAIAQDGSLTGVPGTGDAGGNSFLVRVTDSSGLVDTATVSVEVANALPGLVARYAFNSSILATAGTAHGTATGGPTYVAGKSGAAINFDATDDFVSLPYGIANHDEITVATWVNWNGGGQWQRIFDFGNGTEENFFLTPRAGGTNGLRFSITRGGVTQSVETGQLAAAQWVHVAATLGGGIGKLYVNGALVATQPMSFKPSEILSANNFLGKSQWPDPLFDGRLDEFVIFNRALGTPEIAALHGGTAPNFISDPFGRPPAPVGAAYDQTIASLAAGGIITYSKVAGPRWLTVAADGRISGMPSGADVGANRFTVRATNTSLLADNAVLTINVPAPSGLLAHHQFHGSTADSAGTFPGVASGGPVYADAIFDKAIDLDGTDDFVTLPSGMVSSLDDITIAARVRWDGGPAWQRIFDFGTGTSRYMVLTPNSVSGTLRFTISINGNAAGAEQRLETTAIPIGEWTHVAVTLAGNTGTLYVNGAPAASGQITLNPSSVAPTLNYLGRSQFADPYLNGMIDDFRIYNRGLAAAEVRDLAVPPDAIVVPPGSYEVWMAGIPVPTGLGDPDDDPDADGTVNLFEYLMGSNPLTGGPAALSPASIKSGTELGGTTVAGKHYLAFSSRVKKARPGVTLIPEGAATLEGLALPAAATQMIQAGTPVADGDYEIITWYYAVAVEDGAKGFVRLRVVK